jgi:hypothetical protein
VSLRLENLVLCYGSAPQGRGDGKLTAFLRKPIVDRIAVTIAGTFLFFSVRVAWDALEALHDAGLPVWPVVGNALPFSVAMGIGMPYALKRARERNLFQSQQNPNRKP